MKLIKNYIFIFLIIIVGNLEAKNFKINFEKINFDSHAQNYFTASGISDLNYRKAINQLILDLKAINSVEPGFVDFENPSASKLKAVYPFAGLTPDQIRFNLVDPRDADDAFRLTIHGNITIDSGGVTGDGESFLDTHLNMSSTLSPDNFSFTFYSGDSLNTSWIIGGASGDETVGALLMNYSGAFYAWGSNTMVPVAELQNDGYYIFNRTNSTTSEYYKNGFVRHIKQDPSRSSALPSASVLILGVQGRLSSVSCSFATIGEGIGPEAAKLLSYAVNRYQEAMNRSSYYSLPPFSDQIKPGARIKRNIPGYNSDIYYTVRFPDFYDSTQTYPAVVSFPGNVYEQTSGLPDDAIFGTGIAGNLPVITVVVPFLNHDGSAMTGTWWGNGMDDISTSLTLTHKVLDDLINNFSVNPDKIVAAGFSRGAISLGRILCSNDTTVSRFKGFLAHSYMDGCTFTEQGAEERLARSEDRRWCLSWGGGTGDISGKEGSLAGLEILQSLGISEIHHEVPGLHHSDFFALEREGTVISQLREFLKELITEQPSLSLP